MAGRLLHRLAATTHLAQKRWAHAIHRQIAMLRAVSLDLRISLSKLEVLSLVVQLGGVGRAAEHLYVAQPVVSAHIRSLEERLGTKLFYREGRQMHLTEAGREVHRWAEDVLTRTRELERHLGGLQDGKRGTVVLGSSMTVGSYRLPHVLSAFRRKNPNVELRLSISDTEHAIDDTRTGALDFSIVISDTAPELPGLEVEEVGSDEIILVAAPDAPPHTDVVSVTDFGDLDFVEAPKGIIRRAFVDRQLRQLGIKDRNIVLQLGHPEAMKRATREGLGVTLLFRSALREELEAGVLREVEIEDAEVKVPIYLIYRKGKTFSPLHLGLIDDIRSALSGQPQPAQAGRPASGAPVST
jgi:LysR family transcriptional regulator, low CO2-responsive transcriptional regulator